MRHLITCMGEILIDFLPMHAEGATHEDAGEQAGAPIGFCCYPGGSPCNVAVGLARLGQPVAFVGKLARDFFGRYLHAHLERQGVATHLLRYDDTALSTLAFVALEAGEPVYTFYDQGAADTRLTAADLPAACFHDTRILHVGSISLLRGSTPAAVLAAVERLRGAALISFDPNLRPALVRDEPAYRALLQRMVGLCDIVKLSGADLAWLAPDQPPAAAAADLLAQGAALVVLTQGSAGVAAWRANAAGPPQVWQIPAFAVAVADTVGAGDAFSAGLLAALAKREVDTRVALLRLAAADVAEVLRFAAAVSALTCTRAGADPPRSAEVDQFVAQASV